jgi:RNA polymerase sigma factor for flagellar operon FliA
MSTGTRLEEATTLSEERRAMEDELVRDHLTLVHYVVSDMAARIPRHVSRDDLESAAMAGLAQAARSFDPERGIAFERYAATRIRGALLDELRGRDWASRSVRGKARKLSAASEELTNRLGRIPSIEEIADHLGVEKQAVQSVTDDVHRAVVLNYDSVLADGDGEHIMPSDLSSPDVLILEQERRSYLIDAVVALPERLRRVVVGYFFEERPMHELADELGVSESRISQMRAEALSLLKDGMNAQLEPDAVPDDRRSPRVARRKAAYYAAIAANSDYRSRVTIA